MFVVLQGAMALNRVHDLRAPLQEKQKGGSVDLLHAHTARRNDIDLLRHHTPLIIQFEGALPS